MTALPILLFLASVIALALTRTRLVHARGFQLFRALFPSWRFFEDLAHAPRLFCRVITTGGDPGPWFDCIPPHRRGLGSVILNAQGNLRHACNSLVEETVSDIVSLGEEGELNEARMEKFSHSVSYRLTLELARFQLKHAHAVAPGGYFQFKIMAENEGAFEDALISMEHGI